MKLLSHRGNIVGPISKYENTIPYIDAAIRTGFDVEIDLFFKNDRFYLGHDRPERDISIEYLLKNKSVLWCHAKTINTLYELLRIEMHCFFHDVDKVTLTSKGIIWTFPDEEVTEKSVIVNNKSYVEQYPVKVYGICSDYIEKWRI